MASCDIVGQDVRCYVNAVKCKLLMMSDIWHLNAQHLSVSGRQDVSFSESDGAVADKTTFMRQRDIDPSRQE